MLRKAQVPPPMPPPPGAAPAGMPPPPGMPGMPPPDMGGMPPMPGAPPAMPMAADGGRPELSGPLDTLAKILYDYDIADKITNDTATDPEELTMNVWKAYGGNEMGGADSDKTGNRTKDALKAPPDQQEAERNTTDDSRWLRLPDGKTIADVTSIDDIGEVMTGLIYGVTKSKSPAAQAPPGGMPPPMAAVYRQMVRLASAFDAHGKHARASDCDEYMRLVSSRFWR